MQEAGKTTSFSQGFVEQACYLNITSIITTDPGLYTNNTKNTLCTTGLGPTQDFMWNALHRTKLGAAENLAYYEALVNMTSPGNMWLAGTHGNMLNWYFMIPGTESPATWCLSNQSGCACSPSMTEAWNDGNLMFVTYAPPGRPTGIYPASIVKDSTNPQIESYPSVYHPDPSGIEESLGRMLLCMKNYTSDA